MKRQLEASPWALEEGLTSTDTATGSSSTTASTCYLHIERPIGGTYDLPLTGEAVMLGRGEECRIVLDDRMASRRHARIDRTPEGYRLRDLDSKNGTIVNGRPAIERILAHGDVIEIGESAITFHAPSARARPPLSPPTLPENLDPCALAALSRLGATLASAELDLGELEAVADLGRTVVECDRVLLLLLEERTGEPLLHFATPGTEAEPDAEILRAGASADEPRCLSAPRAGSPITSALGLTRHMLVVPLKAPPRRFGVLVLERAATSEPFPDEALLLATLLGAQVTSFLRLVVAQAS